MSEYGNTLVGARVAVSGSKREATRIAAVARRGSAGSVGAVVACEGTGVSGSAITAA